MFCAMSRELHPCHVAKHLHRGLLLGFGCVGTTRIFLALSLWLRLGTPVSESQKQQHQAKHISKLKIVPRVMALSQVATGDDRQSLNSAIHFAAGAELPNFGPLGHVHAFEIHIF
jgi:hypothetical protein